MLGNCGEYTTQKRWDLESPKGLDTHSWLFRKEVYVLLWKKSHVRSPDGECKFWLEPMIILAFNRGIPSHELREVERLVYKNQDLLRSAYYDFHNR